MSANTLNSLIIDVNMMFKIRKAKDQAGRYRRLDIAVLCTLQQISTSADEMP